jgi:hypothetical protein
VLLNLQRLHDALAACGGDDDATLQTALAEYHDTDEDRFPRHNLHFKCFDINQALPPAHLAILRCDVAALQKMAKLR